MAVSDLADSVREVSMITNTLNNRKVAGAPAVIAAGAVEHRFYTVEYDLPWVPGCHGHMWAASRDHAMAIIDRYVGLSRARIVNLAMKASRGVRFLPLPSPMGAGQAKVRRGAARRPTSIGAAA